MFVIPVAKKTIPDPARGDVLPPEGRDVPNTQYWQRRIKDGDVTVRVEKPKKSEAK